MLSKNRIKLIRSLENRKSRRENQLYLIEGDKLVKEAIKHELDLHSLYATEEWLRSNGPRINKKTTETIEVGEKDLARISLLKNPNEALALVRMEAEPDLYSSPEGYIMVLCTIQDPGNLGTLVRLCDWFGIKRIVCSADTADIYNPKAVQATMGSLCRVEVLYTDLACYLPEMKKRYKVPVWGTFMDGQKLSGLPAPGNGLILFGNESSGIPDELSGFVDKRVSIPPGVDQPVVDSINVAAAAAIVLYHLTD
jgi:TrmH family RNA methyltransferase